jgi:molecular chaperone Hsp33
MVAISDRNAPDKSRCFHLMDKKEAYLRKDRLIRGMSDDGFFQVIVVKTTDVVKEAARRHHLGPLATVLLGRALTGVMLLSSSLKGEERIQLVMQGNGPIAMLAVEANSIGEIRGYVQNPLAMIDVDKGQRLEDGLGIGLLTFSKTLFNEAKPITGTVELVSGNVSKDLAHYLLQSEQIPSGISLDVEINADGEVVSAGGVLIKAMPGAPEGEIELLEGNLLDLPPVAGLLHKGHYIDDIMHKVMEPLGVKELGRTPVHFFCRCNKDRFVVALSMLNLIELEEMADQDQEMVCHYCNERYIITSSEMNDLARQKKIALN